MKFKSIALSGLLVATVCFTASCAKKNPNGSNSDFADGYGDGSSYGGNGFGSGSGNGNYSDFNSGSLPSRDESNSYFNSSTGQFDPVMFAFDSFRISDQEMRKVDAVAAYLKRRGNEAIVAGFTDAIGTEEYNRGLGDRRAHAVSQALSRRGVSRGKVQTVSFGEEMLAEPSSPTSSRNRRVEFGIVR